MYKTAFRPYFRAADMYRTLLPRMKQSPYLALSCPSTYSSVCSIAMFMYPSRQARTPAHYICQLSIIGCGMPKLWIHWVRGKISTIETFFEIFIAKTLLSFISLTIQRPILPILTFVIRAWIQSDIDRSAEYSLEEIRRGPLVRGSLYSNS